MTILNLPRAVNVPFSGAFFHNHPDLAQHVGKVLRLHAGLNNVDAAIALGHPALARFVVNDLKPLEPMMPEGGPGPQAVPSSAAAQHVGTERQRVAEPVMEPQNEVAAAVTKANQEDAKGDDKKK